MKRTYLKAAWAVLTGCVQAALSLGTAWLLKTVVDVLSGANAALRLSSFCILALAYYAVYLLVYGLSGRAYLNAIRTLRTTVKERLFAGVLWAAEKRRRSVQAGEVLSKFQDQLDMLEKSCAEPLFSLVKNAVVLAVSFGSMLFLQWGIALGIAAFFALYLALTRGINKKLEALRNESVQARAEENNGLITMVSGFYSAKDFGQEDFFLSRYTARAEAAAMASFRCNFGSDLFSLVSGNLGTIVTLLIIFAGGLMLAAGMDGVTGGGILGLTQLAASVISPVGSLGPDAAKVRSTQAVRRELAAFAEAGREEKPEWTRRYQGLPKLETLSLQNVSVSYGGPPVLENVSLELTAGKKYAVIGESGSGKTTLLRLLLKLLEPDTGCLRWNGRPYEEIGKADLFARTGYVAQEPMMFRNSVRENIVLGAGQADAGRLRRSLRQSGSDLLRGGLPVDELLAIPAQELSGGEKKRVACARALYRDCEILVLDEATSALHEEMAQELERALLDTGKTVIHVTHGLTPSSRQRYDGIITVAGGRATLTAGG